MSTKNRAIKNVRINDKNIMNDSCNEKIKYIRINDMKEITRNEDRTVKMTENKI